MTLHVYAVGRHLCCNCCRKSYSNVDKVKVQRFVVEWKYYTQHTDLRKQSQLYFCNAKSFLKHFKAIHADICATEKNMDELKLYNMF